MWSAMILVHTRQDDVRKIRELLLPDRTFEQKPFVIGVFQALLFLQECQ